MKAYCINLDCRPDRLEHMVRQFAAQGIFFERVAAVDGRDPDVAAAALRCAPGLTGLRMSAGAYGCFQSHREVWRRLIASGDSHAMVMEDDLVLAPGIAAYLQHAWVPEDANLVKLETFLARLHLDCGVGREALNRKLHHLRSRHPGTGCYVISTPAAQRLLARTEAVSDPIDEALFNEASPLFVELVIYQMDPAPAIQGDRLGDKTESSWLASSILDHFASGEEHRPERATTRLSRRLREEIRARLMDTRYIIVPFG